NLAASDVSHGSLLPPHGLGVYPGPYWREPPPNPDPPSPPNTAHPTPGRQNGRDATEAENRICIYLQAARHAISSIHHGPRSPNQQTSVRPSDKPLLTHSRIKPGSTTTFPGGEPP
ncbi:Hypothetical predicted protein, partial [Pelobates cultripes]